MNRENMVLLADFMDEVAAGTAILHPPTIKEWDNENQRIREILVAPVPVPTEFDMEVFVKADACHTAACALGHVAFHPAFIAQGVTLSFGGFSGEYMVGFDGVWGFQAAEDLFGITERQSERLFDPAYYGGSIITPQRVAARVRQMLAESEKEADKPLENALQ